jgi:hypothetical protein
MFERREWFFHSVGFRPNKFSPQLPHGRDIVGDSISHLKKSQCIAKLRIERRLVNQRLHS